MEESSSGYFPV